MSNLAEVPSIRLRPATSNDAEFAYEVLEQTMRNYVEATWGEWSEARSREEMTKDASDGQSQIIELGSLRIGLLRLEEHSTHLQLEQLFVLPQYQRQGIGTLLLERVLEQARIRQLPVRLRVLRVNPARGLYERKGFKVVSETPERFFMEHAL